MCVVFGQSQKNVSGLDPKIQNIQIPEDRTRVTDSTLCSIQSAARRNENIGRNVTFCGPALLPSTRLSRTRLSVRAPLLRASNDNFIGAESFGTGSENLRKAFTSEGDNVSLKIGSVDLKVDGSYGYAGSEKIVNGAQGDRVAPVARRSVEGDVDGGSFQGKIQDAYTYARSDFGRGIQDLHPSTTLSAIGLIMGTAIGPGILGLPSATIGAGVQWSTFMIAVAWAYVISSILLVAEMSCAVMQELGESEVSFTGLVQRTLGDKVARVVSLVYASLNYALLVACIAGLGSILHSWSRLPVWVLCGASSGLVGLVVAFAPFRILDNFNRALCVLMLLSIVSLVKIGIGARQTYGFNFSSSVSFTTMRKAVPLIVLTLGFHVITPVVCKLMKGRAQEARKAILLGGAVPLAMVLTWNIVILMLAGSTRSAYVDPIKLLLSLERSAAPAVQGFAFAALATTLVGYAASFPKQLADTIHICGQLRECSQKRRKVKMFSEVRPLLYALVPPTLAAVLWPRAFASALEFAGLYANCFLFGILPPIMARRHRYQLSNGKCTSPIRMHILVPGGKLMLLVILGVSLYLMKM